MKHTVATPPKFTTLILLSGLSVVSLNMFLPSLPNIAEEFSTDYGLVNLSVASYAIIAALLQLVMGPLSDRFGRRPIILMGLSLFLFASLGCFLSTNIWMFLFFRMMQAAIISGFVVSLAVVRDTSSEEKSASLLGYMAMAWAVAPMLGPMLGGVLDELFGWRASFAAFAAFGAMMLCICIFYFGETNNERSETLSDQLKSYPELLHSHRFWGYTFCMAFSTGAFYAFLGGAPFVATWVFKISTAELGFYMGTITAGFILGSFISGRFSSNFKPTTTMIAGRMVACVGLCLGLFASLSGLQNLHLFFGCCVCVGIGNGLTIPTSNAGVMSVKPSLAGSAAGLSGAITVGGGAMMASITGAILTQSNATFGLLGMMLLSSGLGLLGALYVLWHDRKTVAINAT